MAVASKEWISRPDACDRLGKALGLGRPLSFSRLEALAAAGEIEMRQLPGFKNKRYYVNTASLDRYIAAL